MDATTNPKQARQAMSHKQIKADLLETITQEVTPYSKKSAESLFDRLVFWKASPSELRGVVDAKLTDAELNAAFPHLVSSSWAESILNHLLGE
jgi:hypothetical protein